MIRRQNRRARALLSATRIALLGLAALLATAEPASAQVPSTCPPQLGTEALVDHDFSVSFCELCDIGTVSIVVDNPFDPFDDLDFSALVISEDLRASGLTYVPFTTSFTGVNVAAPPVVEPAVSGPNGSFLTWTVEPSFVLEARLGSSNDESLILEFDVRRHATVGEEGLVTANRSIESGLELTPSCAPGDRFATTSGLGVLPLNEPVPVIVKSGRNVDAGQGVNSY